MTVAAGPDDPIPWFLRGADFGPDAADEARRREWLARARARFSETVRGREGGSWRPTRDSGDAAAYWSPTPVLGFRFWYLFPDSVRGCCQTWLRPELEAQCGRRGPGAPHVDGLCRCGIYALKAPEGFWQPVPVPRRRGAGVAFGVVALSGVVVEHEAGYRAARARAVAVAVQRRGSAVGSGDPRWIKRLFQRPDCALEEMENGVWPRVKTLVASMETIVRFLRDEASRLERAWTSASRSE